jgi:signal transduction histidine kinase
MVCADDVNLLGDNINTVNKIREAVIDASKEVGLSICYRLVARMQGKILTRR